MLNFQDLSLEERAVIKALAHSPGWALLMKEWVVPLLQQLTDRLDRPDMHESHHNYQRGQKAILKAQVDLVYKIAQLPNPFERATVALMGTLNSYSGAEPEQDIVLPSQDKLPEPVRRVRSVSHPI